MNLQSKLSAAQKSFESWKKVPFSNRQKLLLKLADKLEKNSESLGKIITKEMNKPISQSIAEIKKCALMCSYYANAENILQPEKIKTEYRISEIHYVPKGVILGVMPWNFPFWQVLRFAVPAILAGNAVVLNTLQFVLKVETELKSYFLKQVSQKEFFKIWKSVMKR